MRTLLFLTACFVMLAALVVLAFQCMARYFYTYKIRDASLDIVIFGVLVLKRVPFSTIVEVRETSWWETCPLRSLDAFLACRFGNRLFGRIVLLRQEKGIFRTLLVTPDDTDEFMCAVRRRLLGEREKNKGGE